MKQYKILFTAGIVILGVLTWLRFVNAGEPGQTGPSGTAAAPQSAGNGRYNRPPDEDLQARLTQLQYDVTQKEATERPFRNEYWDNKRDGIYVDIVSGQPLFSSQDKYKSGTGWPSFTRAISETAVVNHTDTKFFRKRVELKSSAAASHLGHLFDDGPEPTGMRYCINSASLKFIPREKLAAEGYADYLSLFDE